MIEKRRLDGLVVQFGFAIVIIALGLCSLVRPGYAAPDTTAAARFFQQANQYYLEGSYAKAARLYNVLVNSGYESGNLYYNLGNTNFKLGKKGWAILYYYKALRFLPEDADLRANLKLAQAGLSLPDLGFMEEWGCRVVRLLPLNVATAISSGLFFLLIAGLCRRILRADPGKTTAKRRINGYLTALGMLLIISLAGTLFGMLEHFSNKGIVVAPSVKAGYAPAVSANTFMLPEGSRIWIIKNRGQWSLIRWKEKQGWIPETSYRKI